MTKDHFDVLVVGAGISGIGAAYHLQKNCPGLSYAILEGRADIGGTWDLFRYPGIRSDSDMHTLGFSFKPWNAEKAIADGPSILAYLRETVAENDIGRHIKFNHLASNASWSSETATWTVTGHRSDTDEEVLHTCNFLFMCSGYYSYKQGFSPEFPGADDFTGQIIHPQHWSEDLDYAGKKVVVIGSGATAMTIVPAMADDVESITMLQRSPTYVVARPEKDLWANRLRKYLPNKLAYKLTRFKNIKRTGLIYKKTRTEPDKIKKLLLGGVRQALGPDYDVQKHFTPSYNPWDQRLCLIPDGDLFRAIRAGKAGVVTDTIDTFTETGIRTRSGEHLEADIIITATGLNMVTLGEMGFVVDGVAVDFGSTWTYKGLGYSDVPNLVSSFGYINASWTLRADLTCEYVCRLLNHMNKTGTDQCTPRLRPEDAHMAQRPWIDDFSSGYMQRTMHLMPKQGDKEPWLNTQNYQADRKLLGKGPVEDGVMTFTSARVPASAG